MEYEALMEDMRAGRDFTSPARNGSVWCYGDITGGGAPSPSFFNIGLEAWLLTRHVVQRGVVGSQGHQCHGIASRHSLQTSTFEQQQ